MTGSFTFIPIIGLFCYAFLFITLLAAKKSKMINAFLLVLVAMILWTGGSFLMRLQFWPSLKFWYDISILGLLLLGFSMFRFACEFVGSKKMGLQLFWAVTLVLMNLINITTGFFLKAPHPVKELNGQIAFIYDTTWPVIFFFLLFGLITLQMFTIFFKYCKRDQLSRKQFMPIFLGILIMFAGHVAFLFPAMSGFPTDLLAGVLTAFCIFYALYRRRLFRLTLLFSRGSCYAMSGGLSLVLFVNLLGSMETFIDTRLPEIATYKTLILALTFTFLTSLIYTTMKKFMDAVFIKDEMNTAENLKEFSLAVSKSLQINKILEYLIDIIQKSIPVKCVYVCIANEDNGAFTIEHSTSPLNSKTFCLSKDSPIVAWLLENDGCLLMKDFKRMVGYRAVWETEKAEMRELAIECFVPLKDESGLVGIILLSEKEHGKAYTCDDLTFLSSVDSIGSIAVKNSRLYQKAYMEARTDELTGLLNRKYFYETIQCEYEKSVDHALTLMIFNLDDFKLYNQLYGNKEGDRALQKVAQILKASVGSDKYIARYSGKEFAVILPQYDPLAAQKLAENIRAQILNIDKGNSHDCFKTLTVSVGICSTPYVAHNVQQLIHYADLAVYNIKRSGKNAVMLYSGDSEAPVERKKAEDHKVEKVYSEYANTIFALTAAIDTKDHYTFNHSENVGYYASELAYALGMNAECVEIVKEAALLHDIGKIGIPEHILNKPGKLTAEEYTIMKGHVENSIGIIKHLPSLDYVIPAVLGHHERYDGTGYPRGIAGEDIPIMARILCVADSFDAMISKRSYKKAFSVDTALERLEAAACKQFDPQLVTLFVRLVKTGVIKTITEDDAPQAAL
ncbi:MAG: diguanylate cyclase [Oscillospiraceae bacterium]